MIYSTGNLSDGKAKYQRFSLTGSKSKHSNPNFNMKISKPRYSLLCQGVCPITETNRIDYTHFFSFFL